MKSRLIYIDYLKAFAIILVVLGHTLQFCYCPETFDDNHLFRYIYSFHMPLFMALSGFCCNIDNVNPISVLKKRSIQLLLPFLSWTLIGMIMGGANIISVLLTPDLGLWFLWALYWICILFSFTVYICNKRRIRLGYGLCVTFLLLLIVRVLCKDTFGISLIFTYFFYYTLGYYTRTFNIHERYTKVNAFCFVLWLICGWFWMRNCSPAFIHIESGLISKLAMYEWHYMSAIMGIIGFVGIAYLLLSRESKGNLAMLYVGRNTLAIYVIHFILLKYTWPLSIKTSVVLWEGNSPIYSDLQIVICVCITIILSLVLQRILCLEKHFAILLFGRK